MELKRKFTVNEIEFRIMLIDEPYMNSKETVKMLRVLAPNGKQLPIQIKHKETLKSIVERSTDMLLSISKDYTVEQFKTECLD